MVGFSKLGMNSARTEGINYLMSTQDINQTTIGGTSTFLEWMVSKGYGTESQVGPWRIALKQVFSTVEGTEDYATFDWSGIDLDDYLERFQRIAGANYKTESIVAYGRRVRNALEAHKHYLETGRAPASKPAAPRRKKSEQSATAASGNSGSVTPIGTAAPSGPTPPEMVTFPYPLSDGRMITLTMPPRLTAGDVTRITTFIRTLQDDTPAQRQLPPGEREAA